MPAQRGLILVRLSRVTDATTSPERQEADARDYCERNGIVVVGVASDLDVSGSTDPLDRPELGIWLRNRMSEWDVIVASKLDRVGRSMRHIFALMNYLVDAGKSLASVKENIDIRGPVGQFLVMALALAAELELESIQTRNRDAARYNIAAGKYRGGLTPIGYRKEKNDGTGWTLVPDEEGTAPVVREIVARVIAGERLSGIVADLNARGVQTHRDRQSVLAGREPEGRGWSLSNVRRLLASPSLIGYVTTGDSEAILYNDAGEPVTRTDQPVVSPADYYACRAILDARREAAPAQRRGADSQLLTQVLFCETCGTAYYRLKGGPGRQSRYRCNSVAGGKSCGNGSVTVDSADETVTDLVFGILGNVPHVRREYVAGSDSVSRMAEIDAELETIAASLPAFRAGTTAHGNLLTRVHALNDQRDRLADEPATEAGYRYVETGETFGEVWESLGPAGRNDFLREHGIRATVAKPVKGDASYDIATGDVLAMVESVYPGHVADVRKRIADTPGAGAFLDADDPATILSLIDRVPTPD